jgi:predicted metal-binding membrane protein
VTSAAASAGLRRGGARRWSVGVALTALAALAWWATAARMAGMSAGPGGELGSPGWFTITWLVMMAAMMLPSLAPTLTGYLAAAPARTPVRAVPFTAGYMSAWMAAGIGAYGVFELGRELLGSELAWHAGGQWLSALVLVAAAAYEFAPLKALCLARCRGRLARDPARAGRGAIGAIALGVRSGGWCIGCSWLLMTALFALGVMSLAWMAVIAALVALEKLSPWPSAARLAVGIALAALAVGVIVSPHDVPGLVLPHAGPAHAIGSIGSTGA